jgi:hypothetical protein
MKIAIIGGGISAMSAYIILKKNFSGDDIKIYSDNLGGDFSKGGLKFINCTEYTVRFFDQLNIEYETVKVNGAIFVNGKVESYPEYMYRNIQDGIYQQILYWDTTRGNVSKNVDIKCMNDPWNNRVEIKLEPIVGIDLMMNSIKGLVINGMVSKNDFIKCTVNTDMLLKLSNEYDLIIYTIPINILLDAYKVKYEYDKIKQQSLNIIRVKANTNKIWWDYLYVPNQYPFHRISKNSSNMTLDIESNLYSNIFNGISVNKKEDFIIENLYGLSKRLGFNFNYECTNKINIKGQITIDKDFQDFNNIFLLGRFAQWNKRITFDIVLKRIYNDLLPIVKNNMN